MNRQTLLFMLVIGGMVGMLISTPKDSFGYAGGSPTCFSVGAGGTALVGEGVVEITNSDGVTGDIDALLRLKYKSQTITFRAQVIGASLGSEGEVLCQLLAANPINVDGQGIIEAFGLTGHVFQIGDKSIKGTDNGLVPPDPNGGVAGHSIAIADLTIFVE
jgi:hypothetical protein